MQVNSPPPSGEQDPVKPTLSTQVLSALYKYLLVKPVNVAIRLIGLEPTEMKPLKLFFIKKLLGSGSEGHVHLGESQGEEVARKKSTDPYITPEQRLARMKKEARVLSKLNHPNIIRRFSGDTSEPVLDISEETANLEESHEENFALINARESYAGIHMEVAEGSMSKFLPDLDDREKLHVCRQLMDATRYMHSQGVYNCDIKTENILWLNGKPKFTDFGSVCEFAPEEKALLDPIEILTTPQYNAPELESCVTDRPWLGIKGSVDLSKSSAWSLAACFAEIMTGEQLFKPEDVLNSITRIPKKPVDIDYQRCINRFFKKHIGRFSPEMVILLKGMLHPDPAKRVDLPEAQTRLEGVIRRSF
ncbi:protein kinase domain-containing protein [Endozoicomonas arenosclerae]|uniref:protein kinase domain-containing protein n=1 Tax=Endozoicomonas arenosclerae TaxID=1633495 RepID=UPI000785B4D9|nr:protein kinase [Endozoicomonas arenosclerae]